MEFLSIILFLLCCIVPSFGTEKNVLDLEHLAPSCFQPDPYNVDACFESCDHENNGWDISLDEVDFDPDLDATVFTYVVNVWDSGVCRQSIRTPSFGIVVDTDSVSGNNKHDTDNGDSYDGIESIDERDNTNGKHETYNRNGRDDIEEAPQGIDGVYIMFNGCCNDSSPVYYTKAITPKIHFDFLKAGWYWKTMVNPGYQSLFGFMIYGDADLTTGSVCARTGYHCICQPIAVPDLCNVKWNHRNNGEWMEKDSLNGEKSIDNKPIWAK